jgi:outer membrane protein assembly factor BamB
MTRPSLLLAFAAAGLTSTAIPLHADWTFFRGPLQNGVSSENIPALPAGGLKVAWKANVGIGTSSIVVGGGRAYTMGNVKGKDVVHCFDAATGREIWKYEYPLDSDPRMFEGGTAATPTLDGNRLYTVSHQGDFFCLDTATGQPLWYHHYQRDYRARRPQWGFAGSALIEGKLVVLDVGGKGASTVAFDKMTGKVVWKSGDDDAGYASPIAADIAGKRTIVMFKAAGLVGLEASTGKELWRQAWTTSYDVNAATPLVIGNRILLSSGYNHGCGLFEVSGGKVTEKWQNKNLRSQISSPVLWQGAVYGIDGDANSKSPLVCLDLETGKVKWEEKLGGGALVVAGGKLVVLSELGELIIGEAGANGFKPQLRQQVLGRRCWVQPTVANGHVFCRNNNGDVAVLAL